MARLAIISGHVLIICSGGSLVAQPVALHFEAAAPEFAAATEEYRAIWATHGTAIVTTLQEASGLTFRVLTVAVSVMEGASWSGTDRIGMRASYPADTKRATLTHELGHILIGDLIPMDSNGAALIDPHRLLFLFLYDTWVELWGEAFAEAQVAVESGRRGGIDYEGIWREVLALTRDQRAEELRAVVSEWK